MREGANIRRAQGLGVVLRSFRHLRTIAVIVVVLFSCACSKEETTPPAPTTHETSGDTNPEDSERLEPASTAGDRPPTVMVDGVAYAITTGAAAGYVPDDACRSCHESLARRYQHIGMARSFYRPSTSNIIENFDDGHFHHAPSNRHYEMAVREGRFYQTRYQIGPDGERINEIRRRVDYIMGSGTNVRTYLYQTPSGELFQLPLAWYSKLGAWRMNPGYDRPDHHGFNRSIDRECMFCHNAYPDVRDRTDERGYVHRYPHDLPEGIGCQRCHGPGAEHARLSTSVDSDYADVIGSISNPSRLSDELQDDVCLQCHLQPMLTPGSLIRIPGRGDYDYKPGESLSDYLFVVDYKEVDPHHDDRFEINHHPYRLAQSDCYTRSGGGIRCTLCHDPHRVVAPEDRAEHFRAACGACHDAGDCTSADRDGEAARIGETLVDRDDCVACHMPKRRTQDVVHVAVTDHLIQRSPPRALYLAPLAEHEPPQTYPPFPYWPDRAPAPAHSALLLEMFGPASDLRSHATKVRSLVEKASPQGAYPYLYLAARQGDLGDIDAAVGTYKRVTERFPANPASHSGVASVLARNGRFRDAVAPLTRALELDPLDAGSHALLGAVQVELGQRAEGIRHLRESLRLKPNAIDPRFNLAVALTNAERLEDAISEFKVLLAVDPGMTDAYPALGLLLMRTGESQEAVRYLRHAEASRPPSGEVSLTLAIAFAESGADSLARDALDRAVLLNADKTDAALLRAIIEGRSSENGRTMFRQARAGCGPSRGWSPQRRRLIERGNKLFAREGEPNGG